MVDAYNEVGWIGACFEMAEEYQKLEEKLHT